MSRGTRRLVIAACVLAAIDPLVPRLLRRLEASRYESGRVLRFENSDLFALGPTVAYMRDHQQGGRPRVVFFGNSIIWGYMLEASNAVPAQFQRAHPEVNVFNMAVNGFELGSSYLITKAIADSVHTVFVLVGGVSANPTLPRLIPIDDEDVRLFGLRSPDRVEQRLAALAGTWQLYALTYRLQAALLGTSTRQYVYLHKGELARRAIAPIYTPPAPPPLVWPRTTDRVQLRAPRAATPPGEAGRAALQRARALLWKFGELAASHRKRVVLIQIESASQDLDEAQIADFNAIFAPYAEVVLMSIPASLKYDGQHLTIQGSEEAAAALGRHEAGRSAAR